jgi:superfamily II RNA helicase
MVIICNKPYPSESKHNFYFELFNFPLSDFQKYAIEAIVEGQHVLVACPTGSGKTLPAEFAIKFFVSKGKKIIYTSPIKALSNQKYYEFTKKFPNVSIGLMTGDIKLNPNADVLIMTTEILMNYLFNTLGEKEKRETNPVLQFQMDLENELGCVVFDEVHYINDEHRGGNWEQTILMLPKHVQMVMLSATIDSPERFAKWCERGEDQEKQVYLAYTNHRIVPLTHYGFLTTNESIFKGLKDKVLEKEIRDSTNKILTLQTAKGEFNESSFKQIIKMNDVFKKRNVFLKRKSVLNNLVSYMKNNDMLPAIAFVFSRKNVELCAQEIHTNLLEDDSKIPYIVRRECEMIIRRLPNHNEYLELPEYNSLVALLEKGIGIHHSGMIPILREIVELFISKKYIKLLFATESFSIGLDCPIKTAVFTGLRKFDGDQDRFLLSHEYTQMAGRAGRRGIDTIGNVIHCNNLFKPPTINEYKAILSGKPQELISKFHISYPVILNLMKQGAFLYNEFEFFVEKSMIYQEITKEKEERQNEFLLTQKKIGKKLTVLNNLKTPIQDMLTYYILEEELKEVNGNKRKPMEKKLQSIKLGFVTFEKDYVLYKEYLQLKEDYKLIKRDFNYIEDFIHIQIETILMVLEEKGYITPTENQQENGDIINHWKMNETGIIASNINEINGLVMAHFMKKWDFMKDFSVLQIIGLLSCFTDIKVADETRLCVPTTNDIYLKERIQEIVILMIDFDETEKKYGLKTGIQYENALNFDVTDEIIEWCGIENEQDCKAFIQNKLKAKEISIGEFTKGILKISVIVKELSAVCELLGQVSMLHKLSQVDGMILKYITICQSLYV